MTFKCTLEHWQTHQWCFITVEDCTDVDELMDHIHREFPDYIINSFTFVP